MPEVNNARMDILRARCDALETQKRIPLPTPEIGHIVWFYRHGDLTQTPLAAIVVGQNGPGQLDLKLQVRNSQNQDNAGGIFFKDHPFVEANREVLKLKGAGVWNYRDGDRPTELHKEMHHVEIDRQLKSLRDELLRERSEQIRRDDLDKEIRTRPDKTAKADKVTSG